MSSNNWRFKLYQFSYRHRFVWQAAGLIAILLPLIALLWAQYYSAIAGLQLPLFYLVLGTGACLAAFAIWLVFPAWYAVWFRYLAWWLSRGVGALWRWLTSEWRLAVILLLGAALGMYGRYRIIGYPHRLEEFLTTGLALKVAVLTALLAMLYWAYQARRRIVILTFTDYTGDKELEASVKGVSAQLLDELARLRDLYRIIDEANPKDKEQGETGFKATIAVDDPGQVLKDEVTTDSKVQLGPLAVPIGPILAFVGRLVQGPRLTGSIHKEGGTLVLIGQISGGGQSGNWRADLEDSELQTPQAPNKALDTLVC